MLGIIFMKKKKTSLLFKIIKFTIRCIYFKYEIIGLDNLPDTPCILVGNHSQIYGPLVSELYFPHNFYTWCIGDMMHLKDVPEYAFKDFWSQKPRYTHLFFKFLSYLIAPVSVVLFNNARTVGVYHDSRVMSTFKNTVKLMIDGANIIIFPEHDVKYNNIVYDFQQNFSDVARLYYKKTKKEIPFVPFYIAPKLKKVYIGNPTVYNVDNDTDEERERIRKFLMDGITEIAVNLPVHTVVPYRNIKKKDYPKNRESVV